MFSLTFCSQFNEDILISTQYPMEKIYFPQMQQKLELEFWSFCVVNQQVSSYPYVEREPNQFNRYQQQIFLMKTLDDNQILAYMYLYVIPHYQLIHTLQVDGEKIEISYNPSEYEGIWILNIFAIDGSEILFETLGPQDYYNLYQFHVNKQIQEFEIYNGGSAMFYDQYQFSYVELSIFRGRLSKMFIYDYHRDIYQIYDERINQLRQNEYQQTINLIPDLFNFDGIVQKEFEFDQFGRKFSIFGWVKYYTQDSYFLKKYLLVRLTLFQNYQDEQELGDEILKITVDIDLSDIKKCGYDVISHHYWMPFNEMVYEFQKWADNISLRDDLPYLQLLSKWHFVSFEHGINVNNLRSQFKLNYFENNNLVSKTYYFGDEYYGNLFINTKFYAFFGGDRTVYDKMKGQTYGFYFITNLQNDLNIEFNCHYSCQTCNGPMSINCLSCYDNNERIFLEESHQCVCPKGQYDKDQKCQSFQDLYTTLKYQDIDIQVSNTQCMFGYFYLPMIEQCIKCPQQSSYNLFCVDCLLNPNDWYIRPICTTDFITQQVNKEQDAYTKQVRFTQDYDLYYIDNQYRLILLEGVYDYCDIKKVQLESCVQLNVQHLSGITFGICKQNRYYSKFRCNLQDVACIQLNQNDRKCIKCLSGYYISDDGYSCLQCPKTCQNCYGLNKCSSCEPNFGLYNEQCKRCGNFCKSCKYSEELQIMQCLTCIDDHLYYLSLNIQDCKSNSIDNCKYAFETSELDLYINSLDYNFKPYYETTITQCAKCQDGYYYDATKNVCLENQNEFQIDSCLQFYVEYFGDYRLDYCLFGYYKENGSVLAFYDSCPRLKLHCIYCLIEQFIYHQLDGEVVYKKASYQCLICENGYYASKKNGECQSCPSELHCLSCYQQNKFTKDNWKNEIRAFYKQRIEFSIATVVLQHKFTEHGLSQNDSDYEILCSVCQEGYEFYGNQCIQMCPESCLECAIINNQNICVKCPKGLNGRNRSLINNQCVSCPQNCELCTERDLKQVHQINQLFNNQYFTHFSYYCISGLTGIFDQELGIYVDCQDGSCFKQIVINLNLYCDLNQYNSQFDQLKSNEDKIKFRHENILSDNLFSNSSFKYFETQEFYEMANQKSIKSILIKIFSNYQQSCQVKDQLQISQSFSTNIFSAIDVELEIYGNGNTAFRFQKQLLFANFKRVHIEGIIFDIEYFNFGPNILKFTSPFEQKIELVNIIYQQASNLTTYYTNITNASNVLIQNILVKDCTRQFSIEAFIKIEKMKSFQTIKINNFRIADSQFKDLYLFMFDLKENDQVEIININIEQTFFNQSLIYQTSGYLSMNQIRIYSCNISSQNGLFQINSLKHFKLTSLVFIQNSLYSGKIINLNQNVNLINLNFVNNELQGNSLFIYNEKVNIENISIENILFQLNKFSENALFMKINLVLQPNKEIIINQISMIENQLLLYQLKSVYNILDVTLIYLEAQIIKIDELIIEKVYGIPDLVVANANLLQLNQIQIKQHENHKFKGLYQYFDCFKESIKNQFNYPWIKIYDVPMIDIKYLNITKAQSINYPIIEIKTSIFTFQTQKYIRMTQMHFIQNMLIITNKINIASLLKITSEEDYQIEIEKSIFEKNLMHQYEYIGQINSGLIFYIDCKTCTFFLNNLLVKQNIVTNSSNSIIYFQIQSIEIHNCSFIENNLYDYSILQPYLFWSFNKDQQIFIEEIQEIFPIKVKTGNAKILCQKILLKDIIISNSTVSGLYISLEKEASVQIQDTIISVISPSFSSEDENGGAFLIDTSFSISSVIKLINIYATKIYCRNKGGLLYIQNVLEDTTIQIYNIVINDVYSLKGSIFYVEFPQFTQLKQQFILENFNLTNSKQEYLQFISKFNEVNSQLLSELAFGRSLFEINNANFISLKNIMIYSLFHESFAILTQTLTIQLKNCRISNSQIQNSLLSLNLMQSNSSIRIIEFHVTNIQILNQIPIIEKCTSNLLNVQIHHQICQKDIVFQDSPIQLQSQQTKDNLLNSYCIIDKMNLQQQTKSSLIDINPQITFLEISELRLKNIKCENCKKGLLNIYYQDDESKIIMNSIIFNDNQCGEQSCLNIIKSIPEFRILQSLIQNINDKQYDLRLQNYKCIQNFAYRGTCLYIQDIKTLIKDSIFLNNTAKSQGGSIYVIGQESFFVLNSVIQFNKAEFGGGLFLKDQIVQNLRKQGTLINSNIGQQFGSNFAQLPSQLSVQIDLENYLPKVKILENENTLIEEIKIGNYVLFQKSYSNSLYVPNGQALSKYQFFDQKKQVYTQYNLHLRLIPLDLFNNVQENLNNTYCLISGRILNGKEESNFTQEFTSFNNVTFNQSDNYNFDDVIFYLDDQQNQTLQLQFHCNSIFPPIYGKNQEIIGYHNNYFLRMNIKSLPCQLGEIKSIFDSTCIPCNATQGLYSLVLNSNNCLQKDDFSTSEIKSAQLKLKPGFWRPYFDTDNISQCINLLHNCNGGWIEGDTSCYEGHVGALCEECDIYNIRGFGHFSTNKKYTCGSCVDNKQNIVAITAISLWTLISILISVRSNVSLNQQMILKKVISRLIRTTNLQNHSNLGILIKMTTNHLQIVSVIFTFKFNTLVEIGNVINAISNPIQSMTHSLDCLLKDLFNVQIHYSRMIWQLIMPFIYISLFLVLYLFALKINKLIYSTSVITTALIYMYIYIQPFLVGRLISLISFRQISGFNWIQANIAYRYDTELHYKWLFSFCLPLLILISLIIPLFFLISLQLNRSSLDEKKTKQRWGYLYNEYKIQAYYWEIIKIFVKQLLIIFLSYYDENIVKKGILLLSLVYIYWQLSLRFQPYQLFILNQLDAYSANVCGISIAVAIGIYIDQQNSSYEIQIPYLIILLTLNLQYLVKIFKQIILTLIEEKSVLFDKIKEIIIIKIPCITKYAIFKKLLSNRNVQKQRVALRYLKLKKYLINEAQKNLSSRNSYVQKRLPFDYNHLFQKFNFQFFLFLLLQLIQQINYFCSLFSFVKKQQSKYENKKSQSNQFAYFLFLQTEDLTICVLSLFLYFRSQENSLLIKKIKFSQLMKVERNSLKIVSLQFHNYYRTFQKKAIISKQNKCSQFSKINGFLYLQSKTFCKLVAKKLTISRKLRQQIVKQILSKDMQNQLEQTIMPIISNLQRNKTVMIKINFVKKKAMRFYKIKRNLFLQFKKIYQKYFLQLKKAITKNNFLGLCCKQAKKLYSSTPLILQIALIYNEKNKKIQQSLQIFFLNEKQQNK
ncbi:unnamed protein product [Paramecium sonneborni]|uniref:Uncharacterized protein n=1 Tax=Paramecium sonneborni TaxID=65129 RepID=A0A8S1QQ07_9CILI|nr:unnamed protein product [Paramecium sonneborni]